MLQKFKNWWNRDKIALDARFAALSDGITALADEKAKLEEDLAKTSAELNVFRTQEAEDEAKRNSTEPWVEIKSDGIDPVKGIQIELDWNEAFIQYLKEAGIKGPNEDAIVQKWIAFLYQDLIERLEEEAINNDTRGTVRAVVNDL
jgi:hypothetical protein